MSGFTRPIYLSQAGLSYRRGLYVAFLSRHSALHPQNSLAASPAQRDMRFFFDDNLGPHLRVRNAAQLGAEQLTKTFRFGSESS